jgi:integrase
MKYKPERDLPDFARELKTVSPSKLVEMVLNKRNERVTPESVTMWFKRHPQVEELLRKELVDGMPTEKQETDSTIFQNGNFQQIRSVKEWMTYMSAVRRIKDKTLAQLVMGLRQVCTGNFSTLRINFVQEGKWCLKHPDRLSYDDALEFISLLRAHKIDVYGYAKTLKSFLLSKGIVEASKLMVGKPRGFARYKDLFVSRDKLDRMLDWVYATHGKEPYAMDCLMFTKAFRINAVVKADVKNMSEEGRITLYEKGLERKYGEQGKAVTRKPDAKLWKLLLELKGDRASGKLFSLDADDMAKINLEAVKKFCPEVLAKYGHINSNHFWRHMFAQHMLRLTNWHTAKVAALGNWTEQALKESYGEPPEDIVQHWTEEHTLEHVMIGVAAAMELKA